MPTLSVLLRPEGNGMVLNFPDYSGWLPFDPEKDIPNISNYKYRGSICPLK